MPRRSSLLHAALLDAIAPVDDTLGAYERAINVDQPMIFRHLDTPRP